MARAVGLDQQPLAHRGTWVEFAARLDITLANLSNLKTGKAKATRITTHEAICVARAANFTGGEFGPESSVCAVAVDLVAIALLWRWKGTRVADALPTQIAPLKETAMQRS